MTSNRDHPPNPSPGQASAGTPESAGTPDRDQLSSYDETMVAQPAERDTLQGSFIGNYRVVRHLGQGAMGKVLLAEHPRIGRQVAIKVLKSEFSAYPEVANRFVAEARAVNAISHQNIIEIYDFGNLPDGRNYYVMEYIEGQELGRLLEQRKRLEPNEIEPLLGQITAALDAAHAEGIIHRDLKPENIYLAYQKSGGHLVKILDFGIAKLRESDVGEQSRTATGVIMGTPTYMSPEQAAGLVRDIGPASDIYSLGVMLYQMLTGTPPYVVKTTAEMLRAHIVVPPPPLAQSRPDLPEAVTFCVDQCLAKNPDERPATASVVHKIFKQGLTGMTVAQAATMMGTELPAATSKDPTPGPAAAPAPRRPTPTPTPTPTPAEPASDDLDGAATSYEPSKDTMSQFRPQGSRTLLIGAAVVLLLVVGVWGGSRLLRKSDSGKGDSKNKPATATPAGSVAPPIPARRGSGAPQVHRLTFRSASPSVSAEITVGKAPPLISRLPASISAPYGERVTVRFTRPGYAPHLESWVVTGSRDLEAKLTLPLRPPPMLTPMLTPMRPVWRPVYRPRIPQPRWRRPPTRRPPTRRPPARRPPVRRPPPMRALDVGTLRPMF